MPKITNTHISEQNSPLEDNQTEKISNISESPTTKWQNMEMHSLDPEEVHCKRHHRVNREQVLFVKGFVFVIVKVFAFGICGSF